MTAGNSSSSQSGLPDALRSAVERTLALAGRSARASSAAVSPRGAELLDELARRGREARDEVARRGTGARDEVGRRLESVERRLASIEELLRRQSKGKP